ncbi:MAG: hypothetical protein L0287_32715 [Anaerolineae bacterium]|nr:hypothetical protein [Anaerolineae bacterium]
MSKKMVRRILFVPVDEALHKPMLAKLQSEGWQIISQRKASLSGDDMLAVEVLGYPKEYNDDRASLVQTG